MDFRPAENDFVITADAGFRYLEQAGILADLVIGDFDTLKEISTGANVVRLSCEKDDTDILAAVREGIKAGYAEFHIYGGTGGRFDHTLANLQVLAGSYPFYRFLTATYPYSPIPKRGRNLSARFKISAGECSAYQYLSCWYKQ